MLKNYIIIKILFDEKFLNKPYNIKVL